MNQEQWQETTQVTSEMPEVAPVAPIPNEVPYQQEANPTSQKQKTMPNHPFDFSNILAFIQKFFSNRPLDLMNRQLQLKQYDQFFILGIYFIALPLFSSLMLYLIFDRVTLLDFLPFFQITYGRVFKTIFGMQLMTSITYFALWAGLEYVMKGVIKFQEMMGQFTKILIPIIIASFVATMIAFISSSIAFIILMVGLIAALLLTVMSYDGPSSRLQLANYWIFLIFILAIMIVVLPMSSAFILA